MKPLRTGFGVGLLAGGVGAAVKLVHDRRAGTLGQPIGAARVVTGATAKADNSGGSVSGAIRAALPKALPAAVAKATAKESPLARRAARRAVANRPAWVVAPTPGAGAGSARPAGSTRPTPTAPRKLPNLVPRNPVSAQSMATSVGKFAMKRAGKAVAKVAAERVGKAIEVIEVLEKVVASVSEPSTGPDMTYTGPGASMMAPPAPAPSPTRAANEATEPVAGPAPTTSRPTRPKPQGNLVSVRKFERGPRVVVGPSVLPPAADSPDEALASAAATTPATDQAAAATVAAAGSAPVDATADAPVGAPVGAPMEAAVEAPADARPGGGAPVPTVRKARATAKPTSKASTAKAPTAKASPSKTSPSGTSAAGAKSASPTAGSSRTPAAKRAAAKRAAAGGGSSTDGGRPTTSGGSGS